MIDHPKAMSFVFFHCPAHLILKLQSTNTDAVTVDCENECTGQVAQCCANLPVTSAFCISSWSLLLCFFSSSRIFSLISGISPVSSFSSLSSCSSCSCDTHMETTVAHTAHKSVLHELAPATLTAGTKLSTRPDAATHLARHFQVSS